MRILMAVMVGLLCALSFGVAGLDAQDGEYPPIAAYGVDGYLWLYRPGESPRRLTQTPTLMHRDFPHDLVWSSDGRFLAFRSPDSSLSVLDITNHSLMYLEWCPYDEVPFAFTMDSKRILFGYEGLYADPGAWMDIIQIELETGLRLEDAVSQIEIPDSYGGSDAYTPPPALVLQEETGWALIGWRFLEDTPFGIVHSSLFEGLQIDGQETIWPVNYGALSPDRTRIATYSVEDNDNFISIGDDIVVIELATRHHTIWEASFKPSLLSWGKDETLFYTSEETIQDLYEGLTDEERSRFIDQVRVDIPTYNQPPYLSHNRVYIHQLDLSDGSEQTVYQTEAFAIGRLMPSPDGTEVFFTTIPNMDEWLDRVVHSQISCNTYECIRPLFQPSLYRLDLASGEVDLIGVGLYKATINFPAYERMMLNEAEK